MSHYYLNDPNLKSKYNIVKYTFRGSELSFITNTGVFSRERIDFGTNLLINSFEDQDLKNKKILDLGCGYGVIGLSIAKAFLGSTVHLIDINERAIELAIKNAELNKVKNVNIYPSNLYQEVEEKFDVIISNPPIRAGKEVVHQVVENGYNHLNQGGMIWMVIQKKQGANSLIKKIEEVFKNAIIVKKTNGYCIIKTIKNI